MDVNSSVYTIGYTNRLTVVDSSVYSLYKMRETFLVEIFCDVNLDEYDRAIGEAFSKLAFEAVERIINVSQTLPLGYW